MPVETTVARSDLEAVDPPSSDAKRSSAGSPSGPASSRRPRHRRLRRLVVGGSALVVLTLAAMLWIDRVGWTFFDTGEAIVDTLAIAAEAIAAEDWTTLEGLYDPSYRGTALGLDADALLDDRDGVRVYALGGGPTETLDHAAAVAEWRDYRSTFETIEAVDLFLHRLESWSDRDEWVAIARFELIGTPHGEARSGIDRGLVRLRFTATAEGPRLIAGEALDGDRVIASEPHFADVAADAGIDFENRYYPAFLPEHRDEPLAFGMLKYGPAGITAVDVDNDGFHDLFVPDGVEARLFRNLGDGTFEDRTAASGLGGLDGVGVGVFADIDNDGDKDAFISRTFEPNQLWRNNGDWTFTDVTAEAGIGADCCTTVASWGDVDNDGFLDLYVGRYLEPRREIPTTFYARNGEPNQLYRNNGDGSFTNITESAGVGEVGLCLGTVFGDYDDDGDADLYVVNDFGRKALYRNEGDSTFTDVTVETGTLAYGAGMSASFGDADNDGDLDLYVAHIRSEEAWFAEWPTVFRYMTNSWRQGVWVSDMPLYLEIMRQSGFAFVQVFQDMASGNTLLQNNGDGTFSDITWTAEANPPGWFWGSGWADFDNDGWQDLYSANGWVYNQKGTELELDFLNSVVSEQDVYKTGALFDPANFDHQSWHGWERNRHLRSKGLGPDGIVRYEEIGRATGTDLLLNSRGTAFADFWNRGVVDLAVAASTDRHALLRNTVGTRRAWLQVELVGGAGRLADGTNRDAVGARVEIRHAGSRQLREIALGDGYGSQNSLRQHFGLGIDTSSEGIDELRVDELLVTWPRSGRVERFVDVPANRIVEIVEGEGAWSEKVYAVDPDASLSTAISP